MNFNEALSKLCKLTIVAIENPGGSVSAFYNPKEVSFSKSVKWAPDSQGMATDYPALQFTNGDAISLSVDLYFDLYEVGGDVRPFINTLMAYCLKHPQEGGEERPPKVKVLWGGELLAGTSFEQAVIDNVSVTYTMFHASGAPCRAKATVKMTQALAVGASVDGSKHYNVTSAAQGSQIPGFKEYCEQNNIDMTNPKSYENGISYSSASGSDNGGGDK